MFTAPNIGERQEGILLEKNKDHLGLIPYEFENKVSRFDLLIYALISNDSIIMKFEYKRKHKDKIISIFPHCAGILRLFPAVPG